MSVRKIKERKVKKLVILINPVLRRERRMLNFVRESSQITSLVSTAISTRVVFEI